MNKSILFVNKSQFGYHIDYLQYCKYLKEEYSISYLCWDYNQNKIEESNINVIYIPRNKNIIMRYILFIFKIINEIKTKKYDIVFIHYFMGVSLIRIFSNSKQYIHLDIRTGSVNIFAVKRTINNLILCIESLLFKSVSVISESLRKHLKLKKNTYILPLGANPSSINRSCKHRIHLLYVGTLTNRRIEDTVLGFAMFLRNNPNADIMYTIIGDGWNNEKKKIINLVDKLKINSNVDVKGYISSDKLLPFFEQCNVGISYIPLKKHYQYQPATKTFEYLIAGMPVIATDTFENKKIINQNNGILIKDNPLEFSKSLENINTNIDMFNNIAASDYKMYFWENIISNLKYYLKSKN